MYGARRNKKPEGLVTGPGTGTSDSIQDVVPEGTYILPADTTQALGLGASPEQAAPQQQGFGARRKQVPINVSNGELKVSPDLKEKVGAAVLDTLRGTTHTPVTEAAEGEGQKPEMFFANGGEVNGGFGMRGYKEFKARQAAIQAASAGEIPNYGNFGARRKNFADGGLVDEPTKPKQTSFDITNTLAAQRAAGIAPANSPVVAGPLGSTEPTDLPPMAASIPPTGASFGARRPVPTGQPLTPDRIQGTPGSDGWSRTGFGTGRQGGEIAARVGANGAAEFTNDANTVANAGQNYGNFGARRSAAGAPAVQPGFGAYRRTPEQLAAMSASAAEQGLAATGSAANLGNGVGTFSQMQAGDSALALDRFEKANQQRQQMVDIAHRGELGNNGGQVTVVKDSSRMPTLQERQLARLEALQANTEATRQNAGMAYQNRDLQTEKLGLEIQNARQESELNSQKLGAQRTTDDLLSLSNDPSVSPAERLRAREQYLLRAAPGQYAKQSLTPPKTMPPSIQKLEDADLDAAAGAAAMSQNLGQIQQRLSDGTLQLGPVANRVNAAKNFFGVSDEESRNYGSMMSTLEKIRNDSLRLNKGVQTEGDAQRAWNELFSTNDPKLVGQRIAEIQALNDRALGFRQAMVNQRRENFGLEPLDVRSVTGALDGQPGAATGGAQGTPMAKGQVGQASAVQVNSPDDLARLPAGTIFVGPDGVTRRKQ